MCKSMFYCDVWLQYSTTKDSSHSKWQYVKTRPHLEYLTGVMHTATWRVTVIFMECRLSWPDLVGYPSTDNQLYEASSVWQPLLELSQPACCCQTFCGCHKCTLLFTVPAFHQHFSFSLSLHKLNSATLQGDGYGEKEVPLEAYYQHRLQCWYGGI